MGDIHQAALNGQGDRVLALLQQGISASDVKRGGMYNGYTVLHCAASKGHTDVAGLLLQHGADPRALNSHGKSAAELASKNGHAQLALCPDTVHQTLSSHEPLELRRGGGVPAGDVRLDGSCDGGVLGEARG